MASVKCAPSFPDNKQDDSPAEETCVTSFGAAVAELGNGAMERLRGLGSILANTHDSGETKEETEGQKEEQQPESIAITATGTVPTTVIVSEDALFADVRPSPPARPSTSSIDVDELLKGVSPQPPPIPSVLSSVSLSSVRSNKSGLDNSRSKSPLRSTGRSSYNQTPIKSHKRGASGGSEINHPYSAKMRRSEC